MCVAGERVEEDGGGEDRDPGLAVGMRRASSGVTIQGWLKLLCVWQVSEAKKMAGVRIVTPDWLWACAEPVGGHDPIQGWLKLLCVAGERGEEDDGGEGS